MAADRLQQEILQCIHKNQYGFIKGRTIHDCIAWAFEYIHQCKVSKKKVIILKLDFQKAFDTLEHEALFQILERKGFSPRWIAMVKAILNSGSSSVLLNGIPGKQYADDTLLIVPAEVNQIRNLKVLLQKFSVSTGLADTPQVCIIITPQVYLQGN